MENLLQEKNIFRLMYTLYNVASKVKKDCKVTYMVFSSYGNNNGK